MSAPETGLWKKETPRQEVSNRSILRIQQLSNELKEQLNAMELFDNDHLGSVKQVLFAARDHYYEQGDSKPAGRWYNYRLSGSYDYKDASVRRWIAENAEAFKTLFSRARDFDQHTAASYEQFLSAANDPRNDPDRLAIDQFLIALAVIPYQGVLPTLFERFFFSSPTPTPHSGPLHSCLHFQSVKKERFQFLCFDEFLPGTKLGVNEADNDWDAECEAWKMPPLKFAPAPQAVGAQTREQASQGQEFEEKLVKHILQFTRGSEEQMPKEDAGLDEVGNPDEDLRGFVVPAYDLWAGQKFIGGMAGWLVVLLGKKLSEESLKQVVNVQTAKHSWGHFTDLLRVHVRRVREANMRDLLEDYAWFPRVPKSQLFFKKHLHRVIGWRCNGGSDHKPNLKIPLNQNDGDIEEWVEPINETCWPPTQERSFPPGTRRLCRLFLDELRLVQSQREKGRATAAEDAYSKTAHQLRKLTRHIKTETAASDLNILRQYFNVTFLSPKNLESLSDFYIDINNDVYGEGFAVGESIYDFIQASSAYALRILPILLKMHNAASVVPALKPPSLSIEAALKEKKVWSHSYLLDAALNGTSIVGDPQIIDKTKTKACYFCALVALWLNVYEHANGCSGGILVKWDGDAELLTVENPVNTTQAGISSSKSPGTLATLRYYISNMPDADWRERAMSKITFQSPTDASVFTTLLPTPKRELFYA